MTHHEEDDAATITSSVQPTGDEGDTPVHPGCEPGASGGRHAIGVDSEIKSRNLKRLRRIEGQVRGLQKMIEEDRYCADVLTQISSVHQALRSVGRELVRNHLKHCGSAAILNGGKAAEEMYDEVVDMMYRHVS